MPNLNLKAGAPAPMTGVRPTGRPGGDGSGGKKIAGLPMPVAVILLVVILLGGGYYGLNKAGIIGKKKAAPVVVAPPPAVTEDTAAVAAAVPENEGLVEFKDKPAMGSEKKAASKPGSKSTAVGQPQRALLRFPRTPFPKFRCQRTDGTAFKYRHGRANRKQRSKLML